ncbi:MAG: NAD(P)H-hydrate epimerase [Zavarzinella sp.]|nr:NAD(P)H-hydrate epimerase [Zavarzinella sp.]
MTPFCLSRAEVRDLDRRAIHEYGVPGVVLMENAGRGAAELLLRLRNKREEVLILCGPGNNGGDGFVVARHLQNAGVDAGVMYLGEKPPTGDAGIQYQIAKKANLVGTFEGSSPDGLADFVTCVKGWIVDAMFGTGLTRALSSPYAEIVAAVNRGKQRVFAIDIPSGLDCDTGEPLGPTIRATHTATFVALKKGFLNPKAKAWLGEVHILDIGAPKKLVDEYRRLRL